MMVEWPIFDQLFLHMKEWTLYIYIYVLKSQIIWIKAIYWRPLLPVLPISSSLKGHQKTTVWQLPPFHWPLIRPWWFTSIPDKGGYRQRLFKVNLTNEDPEDRRRLSWRKFLWSIFFLSCDLSIHILHEPFHQTAWQ